MNYSDGGKWPIRDPVTGLYSRQCFREHFPEELQRMSRYHDQLSIMIIDIDHFKKVNEEYGHGRGDLVLSEFAERIRSVVRASDPVFRYGGDDFIVLLPNSPKSDAEQIAKRLLETVLAEPFAGTMSITLSASIGIAVYPSDATDPDHLFYLADMALLDAKHNGRNTIFSSVQTHRPLLPFHTLTRLLERGNALTQAKQYQNQFLGSNRGVLGIIGAKGSGKTSFLNKIIEPYRSHEHKVFHIQGTYKTRTNELTALKPIMEELQVAESEMQNPLILGDAFRTRFMESGYRAFLFVVDDIHLIDNESLAFIHLALGDELIPKGGLIFTAEDDTFAEIFASQIDLIQLIYLMPFSRHAVRVWLRNLLNMEPQSELTDWIIRETIGLPGYIEKALTYMIKRGIMFRDEQSVWCLDDLFLETTIKDRWELRHRKPSNNIPEWKSHLIGRSIDLQTINQALLENRLITISGPEGIGKSRLALQIAEDNFHRFDDGVFFVALAQLAKEDKITAAIAKAANISFYGQLAPKVQLLNSLRPKQMLLIMDKFDDFRAGADIITEILSTCPKISIIATAQQRLNLPDEWNYDLKGLKYPMLGIANAFESYGAIQLYIDAARRVNPEFELKPNDKSSVCRICHLVNGIPLGIELCAVWSGILSTREIADKLYNKIVEHAYDTDGKDLRCAFEFSFDELNDPEQSTLTKLSIFRNGFTREAASEIVDIPFSTMLSLRSKSLIYGVGTERFYILESLRRLINEKLAGNPKDFRRAQLKHSKYYSQLVYKMFQDIKENDDLDFIVLISEELENIQSGWHFAAQSQQLNILSNYLDGMIHYFHKTGFYLDGDRFLEQASSFLAKSDARSQALIKLYGDILLHRARFCYRAAQYKESKHFNIKCLEIYRNLGEKKEIALALDGLGAVARRMGHASEAKQLHEEGLALSESINDKGGVATALHSLGKTYNFLGHNQKAMETYQKSLSYYRKLDEPDKIANLLLDLSISAGKLGDLLLQQQYLNESLEIRRHLNDRLGIASCLEILGYVKHFAGNYLGAQKVLLESLEIRQEIGDRWGTALSMATLGSVYKSIGEYRESREYYRESLDIFRKIGYKRGIARVLNRIGELVTIQEGYRKAVNFFQDSLEIFTEINDSLGIVQVRLNIGFGYLEQSNLTEANIYIRETLEMAMRIGHVQSILETIISLVAIWEKETPDDLRKIVEILSFIQSHPSVNFDTKENVSRHLKCLQPKIEENDMENARRKGQSQGLNDIISLILNHFSTVDSESDHTQNAIE
ncbi:diguanylate cyclase [bacterium]|nr:diguanylate cyclase [candidate division CSSED10-310 bacterium]